METITGIVLRIHSHSERTVVLCSKQYGNILLRIIKGSLRHAGAVIAIDAEKRNGFWRTERIQTIQSDHAWDHITLVWYHHILELYYYYLPLEQPTEVLFDQLYALSHSSKELAELRWKALVVSFIRYLGEPIPETVYAAISHCLHDTCSLEQQKIIDTWIVSFIKKHPCYSRFNTKNIITTMYPHNVLR